MKAAVGRKAPRPLVPFGAVGGEGVPTYVGRNADGLQGWTAGGAQRAMCLKKFEIIVQMVYIPKNF